MYIIVCHAAVWGKKKNTENCSSTFQLPVGRVSKHACCCFFLIGMGKHHKAAAHGTI